ncbi:MAG: arginine--tRNA ligase [Rhodothermales bacterium]
MKAYLERQLREVLASIDGVPNDFEPVVERPANPEHGDLSTNTAMRLARHLRRAPRQIAEDLAQRLRDKPVDPDRIAAIEVAGAGFLNVRVADTYFYKALADLLAAGDDYGRTDAGQGRRALVEYISANPTGPLTVGHGRNAVLGDTIANLLDWTGHDVTREYYFNDAGRQMRVLGESVRARYHELLADEDMEPYLDLDGGREDLWMNHLETYDTKDIVLEDGSVMEVPALFPYNEDDPKDHGYLGEYIYDIARGLIDTHGLDLLGTSDVEPFKKAAEDAIFADIDATLRRLGIEMDTHFNEYSLYESNAVWNVLDAMRKKGYVYDRDGAVWFKTTAFGKEKDTVLVKQSGEPTYRLPDIAYHKDKLDRGFDVIIDVFGADHIATYPDVQRGISVLGYDGDRIEVIIYQFVTLVRGGEEVKMSTRKATFVTLDELMDEVGEDVTRFFFLMRSAHTHLEFDLDLAKEAGDKNPVFYLQYAHARVHQILHKAEEVGFVFGDAPDLSLLRHASEIALIKELLHFPEMLQQIAAAREPHRLASYLREVAVAFSQFYRDCHIIGEERALATARMILAKAARIVLRNGLAVLGISAPERM